jgi:hypothetical protein
MHGRACYNVVMTQALEEVIERLRQMSPERQDAFARLLLREIIADEQWMRSAAQKAEWEEKKMQPKADTPPPPKLPAQRPNEVVPFS